MLASSKVWTGVGSIGVGHPELWNDPPGAILSLKQRLDTRDDGQSRIACTLRTTRPGRANNNASKTSPLEASSSQASQKNDPFSTGKIDHHSKHLRENKAQCPTSDS